MNWDLPLAERLLIRTFLSHPDAEFMVGDLVERYHESLGALGPGRASARLRKDLAATCVAWWRPRSVLARRRARSGAVHHARRRGGLAGWVQDLRVAGRSLGRRPGFSLGVAITLGLGIGATTTIYSVVDGVMLRPLPYREPGRLAAVGAVFPRREWDDERAGLQHLAGISMLNFRDFKDRARSFERLAALEAGVSVLLPDKGSGPELASAVRVSSELFDVLGTRPALGRLFLPEEHRDGGDGALLISNGAWQRRYGADPAIVGRPIEQVGLPARIVGVLPADFHAPEAFFPVTPDFWMPLQPNHPRYASRGMRSLYVLGQLERAVSPEQARDEAREIAAQLAAEHPDGNVYPDGSHFGIGVNGLHEQTVGTTGRALGMFLAAAGLLLALAALNAATLVLARALDRERELGVRMALGAGRMRVARLLLSEAALLSMAGGAIGVGLAHGGVGTFLRFAPSSIPRISAVAVDMRVLVVATIMSLATGLAAGLLPMIRFARRGPGESLHGAGGAAGEPASRVRTALVGGQVALAVLLLSGASLLFSSFVRILSVEPGFDPDGVITMRVDLKRPDAPDEPVWQSWDRVLEELGTVPGVEAVAGTTNPPFQSPFWAPRLLLPGDAPETWREGIAGYAITPGYLETIGTRLVSGRGIERRDGPDGERVALVNESFVRSQMSGGDPRGLVVRQVENDREFEIRIVGVVEDAVQARADEGPLPAIYVPYTQSDWPFVQAVVRTELPTAAIVPGLRAAVARFNPVMPPRDVRTMLERMSGTRTTPRFQTLLIGAFALVALLIAAMGLYGSMAHCVGRRQKELGVRIALGAESGSVLRLVLSQGMRTALFGLVIGMAVTLWAGRTLAEFLYDIEPNDPVTLLGASLLLLVVAGVASLVPARRATAVDPVTVLRAE